MTIHFWDELILMGYFIFIDFNGTINISSAGVKS